MNSLLIFQMTMLGQGAIKFVKAEYKAMGVDIDSHSNELYICNRAKDDRYNNNKCYMFYYSWIYSG